jgi:two-component system response regulator YesN
MANPRTKRAKKGLLENLRETVRLNAMFVRLFFSFLIIILFISSFHVITNIIYTKNMESEITANVDARMQNLVNELEMTINKIKSGIFINFFLEYYPNISSAYVSTYTYKLMESKLNTYKVNEKYIDELFIMIKATDKLVMPNEMLFNVFYSNSTYTKEFWLKEMEDKFTFRIYPSDNFSDISKYALSSKKYLMPIAFKHNINSRFIMVAMIDVNELLKSTRTAFTDGLYIYTDAGLLIHPQAPDREVKDILPEDGKTYRKLEDGYLFIREDTNNKLVYYKFYSNTPVKQQLKKASISIQIIILISIVISAFLALYMVKRLNNPVKQIVQLIRQHEKEHEKEIPSDFKSIASNIKSIIEKADTYEKDINKKDSLLKSFSLKVKMFDIFMESTNEMEELSKFSDYIVVYFKIHFKENFYKYIFQSESKGTYFLRELIEIYVNDYFSKAVTFQVDRDQIVSVINTEKSVDELFVYMEKIVNMLKSEEEYVFFTIACSEKYRDMSELKNAYNRVLKITDYRKLIPETQLLTGEVIISGRNVFYFTKEQQEQFINSVQSGQMQESLRLINEILDFNYKKEVNNFYIKLLCSKIISNVSTVLMELYQCIPSNIKLEDTYSSLNHCATIEEYKEKTMNFISVCLNHINVYKKESDYIVDYVKNYIKKNYSEDIFLDLLSDKLNISKTYLSSYFKEKTGINCIDYLNSYRIKKATRLLKETNAKVKDIAVKVGIPNMRTFNRLFKKYAGHAPNEYRKLRA